MSKRNKSTIEFTEDFAGRKKGSGFECDSMLASQLVHKDKVAVYTGESLEAQENAIKVSKSHTKEVVTKEVKDADKIKEDAKAKANVLKAEAKANAEETKKTKEGKKGFLGFGKK